MRTFTPPLLALVCLTACSAATAAAGPIEELKTLSSLGAELDERKLLDGEVISGRGTHGDFARGAYMESCFFVRAPLARVGDALLHWNPAEHKEPDVDVFRKYRLPGTPDSFKALDLNASRAADRELVEQTRELLAGSRDGADPGEVHLGPADLQKRDAGDVNEFWRGVLRARSAAFSTGGLAALPTYSAGGGGPEINARAEFRSLLKMTPAIAARFAPLTEARPLAAGAPAAADETVGYWTQGQVRDRTQLAVGLLCARKTPGFWQVLDSTYFTSSTYYLSIDLYQLWPLENGTLVWQVDYISAPFRSYAVGLDKVLAGREMLKDTGASIRLFRRDVEGGQAPGRAR